MIGGAAWIVNNGSSGKGGPDILVAQIIGLILGLLFVWWMI